MAPHGGVIAPLTGIVAGLYVALFIAYGNVAKDRDALKASLATANPAIASALIPQYRFVIHGLINKLKDRRSSDELAQWKTEMQTWERETRALLIESGCTDAEISSFWEYTRADLDRYGVRHKNNTINRRYQSAQFRIDALRRIINHHSGREVFSPLR